MVMMLVLKNYVQKKVNLVSFMLNTRFMTGSERLVPYLRAHDLTSYLHIHIKIYVLWLKN